eukprot:Hpha_TRINITY_DN33264_c0_g1::TRINITY_DN33264_c0_g1_i1::g.186339::m.186339
MTVDGMDGMERRTDTGAESRTLSTSRSSTPEGHFRAHVVKWDDASGVGTISPADGSSAVTVRQGAVGNKRRLTEGETVFYRLGGGREAASVFGPGVDDSPPYANYAS